MAKYNVKGINVGSFDLGEADRVLTIFSAEKGPLKVIAKGSRKPGSKMSGRTDVLCVNELFLSSGRTFEIITQAQSIENFSSLRSNLASLSYGLYYAELTACFGLGLEEESERYFDYLMQSLTLLSKSEYDPLSLCMEFEIGLLDFLGYRPELTFCIACREELSDYKLSRFNIELGGIVCSTCFARSRRPQVREAADFDHDWAEIARGIHITPLVWKTLVLCAAGTY
ncbi:MAG: DNA repair protein RecO, partial [Candidatus Obscuribacterales bacterium]|nr:DNA repair protein RecO [Candidatus Obscuribacterales bacterium]